MSQVFLVDSQKHLLAPIHPGWARRLLSSRQAAVLYRYPLMLIFKKTIEEPQVQAPRIKHVGRMLARATGSLEMDTSMGKAQGISQKYCYPIHRYDGYSYRLPPCSCLQAAFFPPRHT